MIAHVQLNQDEEALVMREAAVIAAEKMLAESLLTRKQAGAMLGVSNSTLNILPIKRLKIGGSTRYRMADLKSYIASMLE